MIKAVLVINTSGRIRLCQFYEKNKIPISQQQELARRLHSTISARSDDLCFFVDDFTDWPTPDTRVVYRRYATLCFIFITDSSESCLAILDLIQVFVEVLDKIFKNVCELDFFFHSEKVHRTLMEIVIGGMVQEMSKETIVRHIIEMDHLASASNGPIRTAAPPYGSSTMGMGGSSLANGGTSRMGRLNVEEGRDGFGVPPSEGGSSYHGAPHFSTDSSAVGNGTPMMAPPREGNTSDNEGIMSSLIGNPFNVALNLLWGGK